MANTVFFRKAYSNASEITWKDVFSDFRHPHTKKDFDYALLAGTSLDTATEADMLTKWNKPWIFYPILKGGIILIILLYLFKFLSNMYFNGGTGEYIMTLIIPPFVVPVVLLVFIWELNIPRNISIYEVLGYSVIGGLLSFFVTSIMLLFISEELPAGFAAFREEPAKLV